jgi:hypothetical protein
MSRVSQFMLRNIDPEFWERVKKRAYEERRPLDKLALRLFELYLDRGLDALEAAPRPK